jgi:transposase
MQFVHNALDTVRKLEATHHKALLHRTKYLRLYNRDRLKAKDSERLQKIMEQNSALALAYQMKENMKEFFMK